MPIKVTYQNPGLEYDENMVCEDFLNMGMLPLEISKWSVYLCTTLSKIVDRKKKLLMGQKTLQSLYA